MRGKVRSPLAFRVPTPTSARYGNIMARAHDDRRRMHDDLQALARAAESHPAPPSTTGFASADSSGFVDLTAFSATDDSWVERELTRAKGGAVLTPGSMAPMAMTALLEASAEEDEKREGKRGALFTGLGIAGVAVVAVLAMAVMRNAPHGHAGTAQPALAGTGAAAAPPPPSALPLPAAATPPTTAAVPDAPVASAVTTTAPSATAVASDVATTTKDGAKKAHKHAPVHVAAAAAPAPGSPQPVAVRPAVVPPPAKASGGDSLMDLIKASVAAKK